MEKLSGGHKKSVQIMSNDFFDPLYSILFYLENVSITVRKELIQSLNMGLKSLVSFMDKMKVLEWANENLITASSAMSLKDDPIFKVAAQIQNSLTAYVYLITWFLQDSCKCKGQVDLAKGRKRVAKKDKTVDQEKEEIELNAIALASQDSLKLLIEGVLAKDVHLLWADQQIDEDFAKCFMKTGFALLEHNNSKV